MNLKKIKVERKVELERSSKDNTFRRFFVTNWINNSKISRRQTDVPGEIYQSIVRNFLKIEFLNFVLSSMPLGDNEIANF